jgi:hypothetical protein
VWRCSHHARRSSGSILPNNEDEESEETMKRINRTLCLGVLSACALLLATSNAWAGRLTKCHITYDLSGWSLAVEVQRGQGTIVCDNGQRARVDLYAQAIGFTIGRSEIIDGTGSFTPVRDISDVLGQYAAADAHAGMTRSVEGRVLTKGTVSLSLSGNGLGIDLGAAIGGFTIARQ